MDLDSRLGRCDVTAVPHGPLRLVWVRPDEVGASVGDRPAKGALAHLDAYRITRVPARVDRAAS